MPEVTVAAAVGAIKFISPQPLLAQAAAECLAPVFREKASSNGWEMSVQRQPRAELREQIRALHSQLKEAGVRSHAYNKKARFRWFKNEMIVYSHPYMHARVDIPTRKLKVVVDDQIEAPEYHAVRIARECWRADTILNDKLAFVRGSVISLAGKAWLLLNAGSARTNRMIHESFITPWMKEPNARIAALDSLFLRKRKTRIEVVPFPSMRRFGANNEDLAKLARSTGGLLEGADLRGVICVGGTVVTRAKAIEHLTRAAKIGRNAGARGDWLGLGLHEANQRNFAQILPTLLDLPWASMLSPSPVAAIREKPLAS